MCHSASTGSAVPPRAQAYVETIVHTCADGGRALVSVVLFGSAAIGGWVETVSDVDLILVVPDCATDEDTAAFAARLSASKSFTGSAATLPMANHRWRNSWIK